MECTHRRILDLQMQNDIDQVEKLAGSFDYSLNEECYHFSECDVYARAMTPSNKVTLALEKSADS